MCGIAGFLELSTRRAHPELAHLARTMADRLRHRGPDDSAEWADPATGMAFGHRRLSILDLSAEGRQPMLSADGRFVICYNGEIYNVGDLRRELEASGSSPQWRGHSDTEVLLAAISQWGVKAAIQRAVGMFALGVWDRQERTLWLVRDRIGEKPLYYGWIGSTFLFASELKALQAHPAWRAEVDRGALALFMRHGYVPAPYSIYEGIYKLPPASLLSVRADAGRQAASPEKYWDLLEVATAGCEHPYPGSQAEAAQHLEQLLRRAVRGQMVADVPLGAFLSGGIDSSTIVALMQAESRQPVRTFSVGFHESGFDEAARARAIAAHLGTNHTELYVTPKECREVIPHLAEFYDEPFADSSQVPTFLIAKLARQSVTVGLSGDGGDEVFGGYNRYLWARRIWQISRGLPLSARRATRKALERIPPSAWDSVIGTVGGLLGKRVQHPADKVQKLARIIEQPDPDAMYRELVSHWDDPNLVLDATPHPTTLSDPAALVSIADSTQRMMCRDALTYLPDDVLVKVDRAAMAVSLETRIPYLDHRVVEFAWTLPLGMKIAGNTGKILLRQVLYRYVPEELLDQPKMGFGVPIGAWLRGPLRAWAEGLLDERRLAEEGFFDPAPIVKKWREHLEGVHAWESQLWNALMFQSWLASQRAGAVPEIAARA
ncbi:MAG: asparagine synthase (glutamine-hydrolyzing) [Acidobacteriota bacterium]|nr:asparagine synthase (glutamine-hydrolyzing) [Acidobacteriota bacterium]